MKQKSRMQPSSPSGPRSPPAPPPPQLDQEGGHPPPTALPQVCLLGGLDWLVGADGSCRVDEPRFQRPWVWGDQASPESRCWLDRWAQARSTGHNRSALGGAVWVSLDLHLPQVLEAKCAPWAPSRSLY